MAEAKKKTLIRVPKFIRRFLRRVGVRASITGLGLLLSMLGWVASKPDRHPWVVSVLAPDYGKARDGLNILAKKGTLTRGSPYLREVLKLFLESADAHWTGKNQDQALDLVASAVGKDSGFVATSDDLEQPVHAFLTVELSAANPLPGTPTSIAKTVNDPIAKAKKLFLEDTMFAWYEWAQWAGFILIAVRLLLIDLEREESKQLQPEQRPAGP